MKYHMIVHGCQMNAADAEKIATNLESQGYQRNPEIKGSDLVVVVMCSVRQAAVDRIFGFIEKIKKLSKKPKTLLTGCILKKDKKTFSEIFDYVMPVSELVNSKRGNKLASEPINFFEARETPYGEVETKKNLIGERAERVLENLPASDKTRAYVTISNGCNNFCTYCVVPYTRGRLTCIDHKKIIAETKTLIKKGHSELWLLGQNVTDYTSPTDKKINFPKLLEMVCNLPGNFKVFFMSPNPKNFSDELIKVMAKSKKYSRYLNLPVQAGDDEILKRMNRPYTAKKYLELVKKIRKAIPDINLSTDVIVGFPGETKKQFENTVKLFKKAKFNIAYINKYSPRKGTAAFNIKDDVPFKEKKRREQILIKLVNEPR